MIEQQAGEESERTLVAACVDGDTAAWKQFYARYQPLLHATASRALRKLGVDDPMDLALDVAADVLAELVKDDHAALARFQGRSSLATWLRVLARRRASRVLRRQRPGTLEEPANVAARGPSPSDIAQVSEQQSVVREQLEALAPRDRLALQLFYEGGRSYREVAAALDLPIERVGTILARARERLAKSIGKLSS